ncbi:Heat shock protein 67B2-like Protein [Tribolium castaneum]|uniref:Heat shock protein 67B2-like Protein n=1 Tax=Tribolium castaneum TaxID=7070 RepID=A0A139WAY7_TRICA|nr:PREDICTED: thiosulfate sulfurtransferase/rhodanese-like domain-containing protein 3 [Tribolium castaneum]KYB25070.1 Heat shock protein 67B2-like Protein [Tribolium castaneum]|eukprot:XP_008198658.1 PREDICTED: thiosulfate sulfurtransferase/rhodanese-like domain-containing protein 3 [Tribolium castaneum]
MSDEVTFDYVRSLKDNRQVLLIDVRNPSELAQTGTIPGSINIPLATLEETLQNTSDEQFRQVFRREKPTNTTPLVFSCQSGRRSRAALDLAKNLGYVNAKHFPGGWTGWVQQCKTN